MSTVLQKQAMTRREARSFKINPTLKVALRRTLQIGHRSGNALKKIAGPSVRVQTVLWSHGSHLNNNCNISIGRAHLNAQIKDAIFRGMSAGFDRFIQHEQQFIEADL
jgi:hypothetical protein